MLLIFRYADLNKGNFVYNYSSKFYLEEISLFRKLYINNIYIFNLINGTIIYIIV